MGRLGCWVIALCICLPGTGSAESNETTTRLEELRALITAGDQSVLAERLSRTLSDASLTPTQRDEITFRLIRSLRDGPPASLSEAVLKILRSHQPVAKMDHMDDPRGTARRYPIPAALSGLEQRWRHEEGLATGATLLAVAPGELPDEYLAQAHPMIRLGLVDALDNSSRDQLEAVATALLGRLPSEAALTAMCAKAATLTRSPELLEALLIHGAGPRIASALREAVSYLEPRQAERLLDAAIAGSSIENAALALAKLSPLLAGNTRNEDRLLGLLHDRALGSAAALALANTASARSIGKLSLIARESSDPLAAARARLSLQLLNAQGIAEP